jgi:hypothetical protein
MALRINCLFLRLSRAIATLGDFLATDGMKHKSFAEVVALQNWWPIYPFIYTAVLSSRLSDYPVFVDSLRIQTCLYQFCATF